jgi:hypothetical protein
MSTLDSLLAPASRSAFSKDDAVGTSVTGRITAVEVRQVNSFDTGKPEFWDDGRPKQQVVVTIDTDAADPSDPEDDGVRNVYIKAWGQPLKALRATEKPEVGDTFTATFSALGTPPRRGFSAPKHFTYEVVKGSPLDAVKDEPAAPAKPAVASTPAAASDSQINSLRSLGLDNAKIAEALSLTVEQVEQVPSF